MRLKFCLAVLVMSVFGGVQLSTLSALPVYEEAALKFYEYRVDRVEKLETRYALHLMDGSQWVVHPKDVFRLRAWGYQDRIELTPAQEWTPSPYSYRLRNKEVLSTVRVSPLLGPSMERNPYLIRVIGFDRRQNCVSLSNGTQWKIDDRDQKAFNKWDIGDVVMFGSNDRWFSRYERVLLNVGQNQYVLATIL